MRFPFAKENQKGLLARLFVVAFAILFAAFVYYFQNVWSFIEKLLSICSPFFIGFGLTFLLLPINRRIEKLLAIPLCRRKEHPKLVRVLATAISVALLLLLTYGFLKIVVPQIIRSIESIIAIISQFLNNNRSWLNEMLVKFDFLRIDGDNLVVAWGSIVSKLTDQIQNVTLVLNNLVTISSSIVNFVFNLLVGLITAIYVLVDRDRLAAQFKKLGYSVMRRDRIEELISWMRKANRIFAGFITGKIVDSIIIGVLCYLGMLIFRMDYPVLISLIIGITNILPFFGPFIGWAPCALILLLINPMTALWFSLWILFLQQLDGNLIGPHILGDYVGVSAFSIMVTIVIGGGLFGFVGMLLSVPVYALLYAYLGTLTDARLKKRKLPTDIEEYMDAPETISVQDSEEDEVA